MNSGPSDFALEKIQYIVIYTQDRLSPEWSVLYNNLKNYWFEKWQHLIKNDLQSNDPFSKEEFDQQDRITVLMVDQQVVAMHLIGRYTPADYDTHPYFKGYHSSFMDKLKFLNLKTIYALQYFWVDQKFARKHTGQNFAAILASLSLKHQVRDRADATLTIARRDIMVHETASKFGFVDLVEPMIMHNVSVSQMIVYKPNPYPSAEVEKWSEFYWNNRYESISANKEIAA